MKRVIIVLAILLAITTTATAETYPQTFIVTDTTDDILTLETFTGHTFQAYGVEDYMVGDMVAAIMDDNGTDNITDDIILQLRYSGYVDGWQR